MARNWREHERGDRIKWVAVFLAVVLLAVAVMAAMTKGFTDWNPYGWFGKVENPTPGGTDNTVIGGITENGVKLSVRKLSAEEYADNGVSPMAETAYTLTATVLPENADNKQVDYAVTWKNAAATWASGKTVTEYVTATQATDGALTATVECLQAFGEQITVTVTSRDNAAAKAVCTVDYIRRVTSFDIAMSGKTQAPNSNFGDFYGGFDSEEGSFYSVEKKPVFGIGTIDDTVVLEGSGTVRFNIGGLSANSVELPFDMSDAAHTVYDSFRINKTFYLDMFCAGGTTPLATNSQVKAFLTQCCELDVPGFVLELSFRGTYTGSSGVCKYYFDVRPDAIWVPVISVESDNSTLVF